MKQRLPVTAEEMEMAEQSGLSDTSRAVSSAVNGVTISVEQTVIDRDTAHIALRIDGFTLPEGQYPDIGLDWSLTFDGEPAPNMSGSFVGERDSNGNLIFAAPDGSMEFDFTAKAGDKWESFAGKEIRIVIDSLGSGDKGRYQMLVDGPWELVWTPSSNVESRIVLPDAALGDTGIKLVKAEISPISVKVTLQLPELWEGYKTLEPFDWHLFGARMKDGTQYQAIFGPPSSEGYADADNLLLEQSFSSYQILEPEQVEALIFAPQASTGGRLIYVSIG